MVAQQEAKEPPQPYHHTEVPCKIRMAERQTGEKVHPIHLPDNAGNLPNPAGIARDPCP